MLIIFIILHNISVLVGSVLCAGMIPEQLGAAGTLYSSSLPSLAAAAATSAACSELSKVSISPFFSLFTSVKSHWLGPVQQEHLRVALRQPCQLAPRVGTAEWCR